MEVVQAGKPRNLPHPRRRSLHISRPSRRGLLKEKLFRFLPKNPTCLIFIFSFFCLNIWLLACQVGMEAAQLKKISGDDVNVQAARFGFSALFGKRWKALCFLSGFCPFLPLKWMEGQGCSRHCWILRLSLMSLPVMTCLLWIWADLWLDAMWLLSGDWARLLARRGPKICSRGAL